MCIPQLQGLWGMMFPGAQPDQGPAAGPLPVAKPPMPAPQMPGAGAAGPAQFSGGQGMVPPDIMATMPMQPTTPPAAPAAPAPSPIAAAMAPSAGPMMRPQPPAQGGGGVSYYPGSAGAQQEQMALDRLNQTRIANGLPPITRQ